MPEKLQLDLAKLEELAAAGKTQPEIAEALGFKFSTFTLRLKNKETRDVYESGRKIAEENGIAPKSFRKTDIAGKNSEAVVIEPDQSAVAVPPVAETPAQTAYDERALIKKAVSSGRNLVASIADFTDLTKLETQKFLWEMCESGEVEHREVGTLHAWFIKDEVPTGRLMLSGNGGVVAETKSVAEESKAAVVASSRWRTATHHSLNNQNGNGSGSLRNKFSAPEQEKPETPKTKINHLEVLKKVQAELAFFEAYWEFSPRCDSVMQELAESFK